MVFGGSTSSQYASTPCGVMKQVSDDLLLASFGRRGGRSNISIHLFQCPQLRAASLFWKGLLRDLHGFLENSGDGRRMEN